jgi:hypothetical protein
MGERFIIEDVYFRSGGISIYLRNTGKVAATFSAVYMNNSAQSITALNLDISGHDWLNFTYTWTAGNVYYISVATIRGTQVADYYRAPS